MTTPSAPNERSETVREAIRAALLEGPATAYELSGRVSVAEREVASHLEHLARSLAHRGERLVVDPPICLGCGFAFERRERLKRPSACPRCRGTHLAAAKFSIEGTGSGKKPRT